MNEKIYRKAIERLAMYARRGEPEARAWRNVGRMLYANGENPSFYQAELFDHAKEVDGHEALSLMWRGYHAAREECRLVAAMA